MLDFKPLASSSAGCCYHLSGGDAARPLLIEAGIPFAQIQKGIGFRVSELAGCLVTHAHGDHACAMADVMGAGVDVHASKETHAHVRNRILLRNRAYPSHRAKEIRADQELVVGDWTVLPFATVHDAPGALGFVIGSPDGQRLLFLTDTAYSRHTFEGLTEIAVECNFDPEIIRRNKGEGRVHAERFSRTHKTHMSLPTLLDLLRANDLSRVERIWLLHLSSENSDEAAFKAAVERTTGIPVTVCGAGAS